MLFTAAKRLNVKQSHSFTVFVFVSLLQTMRRHRNEVTVELRKVRKHTHTHVLKKIQTLNKEQSLAMTPAP